MIQPVAVFSWPFAFGVLALPAVAQTQEVFAPPMQPPEFWALQAHEAIEVDGDLNEPIWARAASITAFVQRNPDQGTSASYPTDVRIVFDNDALYIGAHCYQPRNTARVQNLRRDFAFDENDLFGVAIDGFLDKRSAVAFQTTPYGSQGDMEFTDTSEEGQLDWDARWKVRTKIRDTHWTAEMAIPWRNLRYPTGADRLGVVFTRNIRSLNEQSSVPAVPRALPTYRMAYEAELRGIVPPRPETNVQLNPYALYDRTREDPATHDAEREVGGELKWAITPSTVLDLTWNTDFAQAEVDRQVTNLDRFSVFFPERRQFFLESASIFNASVTEWISPFFSRRIGLDERGQPIPLDGGLRLISRSSRDQIGVLAVHQQRMGASPATSFAVARYSRNVLEQSRLGGMLTYRHDESFSLGNRRLVGNRNATYTADGLWRPNEAFGIQGMLSASADERRGEGLAGQLWAFFDTDNVQVSVLEYYDRNYNPGIGLELLDANYVMHSVTASYDFRSDRLPASLRSVTPGVSAFVFQSSDDGDLLFAYAPLRPIRLRFQSGAQIDVHLEPNWQQLDEPFFPLGIEIAQGRYDYMRYRVSAKTDQSARLAASVGIETGQYFDGELTTYSAAVRAVPWPHLELSADVEVNQIRGLGVAAQSKTTSLYGVDTRLALNPRLQMGVLYQHDDAADRSAWNLRLSWEYLPLSYFYLVYSKHEGSGASTAGRAVEDQIIAKLTFLFEL